MSDYDHGPLRTYEITWRDRPPEMVQGHQVTWESTAFMSNPGDPKFFIHGQFPGNRWRLVIMAPESAVISIRDVTEQVAALEAIAAEGQLKGTGQ